MEVGFEVDVDQSDRKYSVDCGGEAINDYFVFV